jgi:hypothetical protein
VLVLSVEPPTSWPRSPIGYVIFAFKREESLLQTLLSLHISLLRRQETVACYVSLHIRNYTIRDRMLEILRRVRFCDMEVLAHDIVEEVALSPEKSREAFFNEHWLWTLNEIFEVRKIANDVIFVEDDTPLSPDHRDFAFFASRAKSNPEAFSDPYVSQRLHSVHWVAFNIFGGKISTPNDETVIIRKSPVFPTWGYMFNATFYHLIIRHQEILLTTNYKGVPHFSAAIAKISFLYKQFPMVQMVPTRSRSWHNGNVSSIHGHGYDYKSNEMHIWNLMWSSPWIQSSMKPIVCNEFECYFRILPCWSGHNCGEWSNERAVAE